MTWQHLFKIPVLACPFSILSFAFRPFPPLFPFFSFFLFFFFFEILSLSKHRKFAGKGSVSVLWRFGRRDMVDGTKNNDLFISRNTPYWKKARVLLYSNIYVPDNIVYGRQALSGMVGSLLPTLVDGTGSTGQKTTTSLAPVIHPIERKREYFCIAI